MRSLLRPIPLLFAAAVAVAACGSEPAPVATAPPATPVATEAAPAAAAAAEIPTDPAPPADWLTTATRDGDYYVLGNPAAPVRLTDYSDFL